ncbi:beta-galactosidase [Arenicella sp. 4NH20-0111]|uniref:beta-galactosidase n=1 Tax=Arenicella sp. 4NH20-0111 TaxID=3127648 RepID=UPI00310391CE
MKPILGTCYYPEHWDEALWPEDALKMSQLGLKLVRIGEFSWSRIEPKPGEYDWAWLDRAIEVLGDQGLKVVMGTPSATPPRWMLDRYPDMLAVDEDGQHRKFGSRRHYCFSHAPYREEAAKIAELMAERYGGNRHVHSWQLDNEYGCHDTILSYSDAARKEFRRWLKAKYSDIAVLNEAWGNIFWSMAYSEFEDVDLPNLTVTEPNPSHVMDFRRFSSDQVVVFNKALVTAVRRFCDKPLIHNYMGRITEFDHYKVGDDLDIASWDSYPLGFLVDRCGASKEWQRRFERQGDPDLQALHHDLYRTVGRGRWWVMEQQPGPVNWAPFNPAPLPGMVRLWTLEAIAHEAEAVCYFRWRQAPFAQEQMHAGLLRPDSKESASYPEIEAVIKEISELGDIACCQADVALVFDYESCWAWEAQPQGQGFDAFGVVFEFYRGLRRLGLTVDIVRPDVETLDGYKLLLAPGLFNLHDRLLEQIDRFDGVSMLGPRTGSRDQNFRIPTPLPPALDGFDCTVEYVETFPKESARKLQSNGSIHTWFESLQTSESVFEFLDDGSPVLVGNGKNFYLGAWPDELAMQSILLRLAEKAQLSTEVLPEGVRKRETQSHEFVFNHNAESVMFRDELLSPAEVRIRLKK